MTPTAALAMGLLLIGAALAYIAIQVGGPFTGGAVAAFGAAAALAGAHSIITRSHRSGHESSNLIRDHSGVAAVLFGLTFLVPGLILVGVGLASVFGKADGIFSWAAAHPGSVVAGIGGWTLIGGLGMLVSRWKYAEFETSWWQRLPGQLLSIVVMLMGIGLLAAGRVLARDPDGPGAALGRIAEWVARMLSGAAGG